MKILATMTKRQVSKLIKTLEKTEERIPRKSSCSSSLVEKIIKRYNLKIVKKLRHEYINRSMTDQGSEVNLHNVHHFMIAKPSSRLKANFDLGPVIDDHGNSKLKMSKEEADWEEELTACLDYLRALEGGYHLKKITYVPEPRDLQTLFSMGLIDIQGKIKDSNLRPASFRFSHRF